MTLNSVCKLAMTLVLALGANLSTYAWSPYGHMMVAYVAYQNLNPQAMKRANELIQLNPKLGEWLGWVPAGSSAADTNMILFMIASTWADEIKSDTNYITDGTDNGNRPDGSPDPTANKGYDDLLKHKYWHFIDRPFTQDGASLPSIPTPNVQERIGLFRGVLASGSADPLKSYDLTWLLHLVGDVHQPLHGTTRISTSPPQDDSGGNLVKLNGSPNELHAFWDDVLGAGQPQNLIKPVIKAAKKLPPADPTLAAKSSENDWAQESFQAAQDVVYQPPIGLGAGPFTPSSAYKKKAKSVAQQRIALAGVRLANLLNNELK